MRNSGAYTNMVEDQTVQSEEEINSYVDFYFTRVTPKMTEKEKQFADRRVERGGGRSQIIRRRESLVLYNASSLVSIWLGGR
jgi:hypothetical protein